MELNASKRKRIKNLTTIFSMVLLAGMAVFFYFAVRRGVDTVVLNIVISAFLLIFWAVMDIIEPRLLHELDDLPPERKLAYYKYIGVDALGYAALGFFVLNLGSGGNNGIWGALVYALAISAKRRFRDEYQGVKPAEDTE